MSAEMPDKDVLRKLSRVVLKTEREDRRSLFETLTAKSAAKIAELMQQKPIFYEDDESAPREILLDPEVAGLFPEGFFENPTAWIESQPNVERFEGGDKLPSGETIEELRSTPYDVSKVKQFSLGGDQDDKVTIVSKRVPQAQLEEIARARKAYEASVPTQKVFGEIIDQGNIYVFLEYIPGLNFDTAWRRMKSRNPHSSFFSYVPSIRGDFFEALEEAFDGLQDIDRAGRERLRELVTRYKEALVIQECRHALTCNWSDREEAEREIACLSDWVGPYLEDLLHRAGFESVEDYLDKFPYQSEEGVINLYEKIDMAAATFDRSPFDEEWRKIVREEIFGFDYIAEIENLQASCEKAGIGHKDFAGRNILIPWDFERDRPAARKEGEPRLYVIDWEVDTSKKKRA